MDRRQEAKVISCAVRLPSAKKTEEAERCTGEEENTQKETKEWERRTEAHVANRRACTMKRTCISSGCSSLLTCCSQRPSSGDVVAAAETAASCSRRQMSAARHPAIACADTMASSFVRWRICLSVVESGTRSGASHSERGGAATASGLALSPSPPPLLGDGAKAAAAEAVATSCPLHSRLTSSSMVTKQSRLDGRAAYEIQGLRAKKIPISHFHASQLAFPSIGMKCQTPRDA